jgi:hypothetical protein
MVPMLPAFGEHLPNCCVDVSNAIYIDITVNVDSEPLSGIVTNVDDDGFIDT